MSLDLNKLSNKLDEALIKETTETLTKFLNDKRMTNNKQQTAVDWQFDQLSIENLLGIFTHDQLTRVMEILEQAKEMEKQMTIKLNNDYENYLEETFKNQCGGQAKVLSFEEFYEQTYGGNK